MNFLDDIKKSLAGVVVKTTKLDSFLDTHYDNMMAKGKDDFVIWLHVGPELGWEKKNKGDKLEKGNIIVVNPPRGKRGVPRAKVREEYQSYLATEMLKGFPRKNTQ